MTSKSRTCPICKKPRDQWQAQDGAEADRYAPFCSSRCRDRDLSQWFGDGYSVPGRAALPEEIAAEVTRGTEE